MFTLFHSFTMKLIGNKRRHLAVRSRLAVDDQETHGQYAIGEIAGITRVGGVNYVTSLGIAARRDEMTAEVRDLRDKEDEKSKDKSDDSDD